MEHMAADKISDLFFHNADIDKHSGKANIYPKRKRKM
jgi:hypothetical protein